MGLWDERFSRYCSIVLLRELVLGLLEALTTSKQGRTDDIDLKAAADFGMEMVEKSKRLAKGEQVPLPKFEWLRSGLYAQVARELKGGQIGLVFDQEKCKYPECRLCVDNCPMGAIDLSVDPPVVFGKGCINCYFCELTCPAGAINYFMGLKAWHEYHRVLCHQYNYPEWFKKANS